MDVERAAPPAPRDVHGMELLSHQGWNKGTAFTDEERSKLGLHGLLPPYVETIEQQLKRAYEAYQRKDEDLERHIYLRALQDTNEVLFYRLLLEHIEEMTPIVYTPVVAQACEQFSHIYRRPRGMFVSYPLRLDSRAAAEPTELRRRRHRRHRRRTHSGHWRSRRRRPGHPDRQAFAHPIGRHAPCQAGLVVGLPITRSARSAACSRHPLWPANQFRRARTGNDLRARRIRLTGSRWFGALFLWHKPRA